MSSSSSSQVLIAFLTSKPLYWNTSRRLGLRREKPQGGVPPGREAESEDERMSRLPDIARAVIAQLEKKGREKKAKSNIIIIASSARAISLFLSF